MCFLLVILVHAITNDIVYACVEIANTFTNVYFISHFDIQICFWIVNLVMCLLLVILVPYNY